MELVLPCKEWLVFADISATIHTSDTAISFNNARENIFKPKRKEYLKCL
jgi:hypothetical protein